MSDVLIYPGAAQPTQAVRQRICGQEVHDRAWWHVRDLAERGVLSPDSVILDLGCGYGRIAYPLQGFLGERGFYVGLDCCRDLIDAAAEAFRPDPRFGWIHVDVRNEMYNPQGGDFERFPVPDGGFTAILAQSFFSHIAPPLSVLYLAECRRVLDKGGLFYSTWFRTQDKGRISGAAGRTVYLESDIRAMLSGAGFDIVDLWGPDESEGYHAQSEVVCRPRERVRA